MPVGRRATRREYSHTPQVRYSRPHSEGEVKGLNAGIPPAGLAATPGSLSMAVKASPHLVRHHAVVSASLSALSAWVEWTPMQRIATSNVVEACTFFLDSEEFRLAALAVLKQVMNTSRWLCVVQPYNQTHVRGTLFLFTCILEFWLALERTWEYALPCLCPDCREEEDDGTGGGLRGSDGQAGHHVAGGVSQAESYPKVWDVWSGYALCRGRPPMLAWNCLRVSNYYMALFVLIVIYMLPRQSDCSCRLVGTQCCCCRTFFTLIKCDCCPPTRPLLAT
jgi:hypothetical protein